MNGLPRLTDHAVERYIERLQRPLEFEDAKRELERLLPFGHRTDEAPKWCGRLDGEPTGFWVIGDVCLVLQGYVVAVTCITRGTLPAKTRARRNRARRYRRHKLAQRRAC